MFSISNLQNVTQEQVLEFKLFLRLAHYEVEILS